MEWNIEKTFKLVAIIGALLALGGIIFNAAWLAGASALGLWVIQLLSAFGEDSDDEQPTT